MLLKDNVESWVLVIGGLWLMMMKIDRYKYNTGDCQYIDVVRPLPIQHTRLIVYRCGLIVTNTTQEIVCGLLLYYRWFADISSNVITLYGGCHFVSTVIDSRMPFYPMLQSASNPIKTHKVLIVMLLLTMFNDENI